MITEVLATYNSVFLFALRVTADTQKHRRLATYLNWSLVVSSLEPLNGKSGSKVCNGRRLRNVIPKSRRTCIKHPSAATDKGLLKLCERRQTEVSASSIGPFDRVGFTCEHPTPRSCRVVRVRGDDVAGQTDAVGEVGIFGDQGTRQDRTERMTHVHEFGEAGNAVQLRTCHFRYLARPCHLGHYLENLQLDLCLDNIVGVGFVGETSAETVVGQDRVSGL